jgi:hypothetical protein
VAFLGDDGLVATLVISIAVIKETSPKKIIARHFFRTIQRKGNWLIWMNHLICSIHIHGSGFTCGILCLYPTWMQYVKKLSWYTRVHQEPMSPVVAGRWISCAAAVDVAEDVEDAVEIKTLSS